MTITDYDDEAIEISGLNKQTQWMNKFMILIFLVAVKNFNKYSVVCFLQQIYKMEIVPKSSFSNATWNMIQMHF